MFDPKRYLEALRRSMSLTEFRAFYDSEAGLSLRWWISGYDPKAPEAAPLYEASISRLFEAWEQVWERVLHLPEAFQMAEAERLMMDTGYQPPHWDVLGYCANCEHVFLPPGSPAYVEHCPWCDTWLGLQVQARRDHCEEQERQEAQYQAGVREKARLMREEARRNAE